MKSVLVTGASTGIGYACVAYLAERNLRVFAGVRKLADAEALRHAFPAHVHPVLLDVCKADEIAEAQALITETVGEAGLDGLVNNAGIAVAGPLEFLPLADVRRQMDVNVTGALALIQACLPLLRRAQGRIVNMSSISGRRVFPFVGAYGMSKFALEAMSDALRVELAPWGIHVALIEPGTVRTPIWEKSAETAANIWAGLPAEAETYYGSVYMFMRKEIIASADRGIQSKVVAQKVYHALMARRPRIRYLVGRDAKRNAFLAKRLPDRFLDRVITRRIWGRSPR